MLRKIIYRLRRLVILIEAMIAMLMVVTLFSVIWYKYYAGLIIEPFYKRGHWLLICIYFLFVFIFFHIYGGYKYGILTTNNIIYSQVISLVIVNIITYFQISLIARWLVEWIPMLLLTLIQASACVIWSVVANSIYFAIYPASRMIIVYGSPLAQQVVSKMDRRREKYKVCASLRAEHSTLEEIWEKVEPYDAIILCDVEAKTRNKILKLSFEKSKRVYMIPKLSDILIRGADDITLFDTPLLECRNRGLNFEQRLIKRTVDIVLSMIGIIITSPFMIFTAIAIKAYDGGHVFYKQVRCTKDSKTFEIIKFRSMIEKAENDGKARLASENDDRITPVGKIIRRYRLDELPQLFNILKGDMSIVGPRPERPELVDEYIKDMPEFIFRQKVKAGLTGYAQVIGKYNTTIYDKLKMDLMYIQNYSLFLDFRLILMTIKIMFIKESTEGVQDKEN